MADSYEFLKAHFDRIQADDIAAHVKLHADHADLCVALRDLLNVIAADELIPESVSYMRQARAVLLRATQPLQE